MVATTSLVMTGLLFTFHGAVDAAHPASWEDLMKGLYEGERASAWDGLKAYTGEDAHTAIVGEERKKAYLLNFSQMQANYGDNVDFQLRAEQVILCPQTVDFLYGGFTPLTVRYQKGSRPQLERVVADHTAGCKSESAKALALMRYCRDLYDAKWYTGEFKHYIYGGREEQLIAKGEILCECLGRLHVALCEVAGIPGRIVMHVIGGHICTEVYVDGQWAYMDPRTGFYCLKPDGRMASVWEIWRHPEIIDAQRDTVKADVSKWFTWEERAWKCKNKYFHTSEVNGFQNYSLAHAGRYHYKQKTYAQTVEDGLFDINKEYVATANAVFGLEGDGFRHAWGVTPLQKIPIAYRHDGFSIFYEKPPLTPEILRERYVDPLANSNAPILVWGLGPGSVFCYDTKVGEVFGEPLTAQQLGLLREGDRWVHQNVMDLIRSGNGPLRVAVARSHELGLKILARLEMNHEYGPADPENWLWVGLVGSFNKNHPEYRIPGSVLLDFKHQEVRDFKLAILREALDAGVDGVALDLAVYPPFFENPKEGAPIMTQFVRDVRALLEEFAAKQERPGELMVRVPARNAADLGLDWETWMREGLLDYIVPTHYRPNETFDVEVGDFVSLGHRSGVQVFPTVWQALGFVSTDQAPEDEETGNRRYDKPKTKGMYYAQALLFHRAGVDGLQLGFSEDQFRTRPWLNDLADPAKVAFADKHYMVDVRPHCPITFPLPEGGPFTCEKSVPLRIGDDVAEATRAGYRVAAALVLYAAPMREGDALSIFVNGNGPVLAMPTVSQSTGDGQPIDPRKAKDRSFIFEKEWWRKGQLEVSVPAAWWQMGPNEIRLRYTAESPRAGRAFYITWVDLTLDYADPQ